MEKVVKIGDIELWTDSEGAPADPACLLIAGAGAHARFWSDSFCDELVRKGFFVIRYDLRDSGKSSAVQFSTHPYTIEDLADDVVKILDGYGIEKAHLVGHSMGAYIAQYASVLYPDRVLSIVSMSAGPIGSTPLVEAPWSEEEKELMGKTWAIMVKNKPTADFEESYPGYQTVWKYLNGDYFLDDELARTYTQDLFTRSIHKPGVAMSHLSVMRGIATKMAERADDLKRIKAPTLVIHGDKDYLVPAKRGGESTVEGIPNAKYELISGMGHMIFNHDLETKLITLITDHFRSIS